jgi:hypothetical protein
MANVVKICLESVVNQHKYLSGKDDENCALMKVKLKSLSLEMKSMQLVMDILQEEMDWLKKECRQDVSTGNVDQTNKRKHEEGIFPSCYSNEWTEVNKNSHKKMLPSPKEPAPVTTRTANCFEVL